MTDINHMTDVNRRRSKIGGYTVASVVLFFMISVAAIIWAVFGDSGGSSSPIIVASIFGVMGLAFALLGVRWTVEDGYLKVTQWGIRKKVPIHDIDSIAQEKDVTWKQGVGIRWMGPGDIAMVCGSKDVVHVTYGNKSLHFSVDRALDAVSIIEREMER